VDKLRDYARGLEEDLVDLGHRKETVVKSVSWDRLRN
jgi:hypothetical protein